MEVELHRHHRPSSSRHQNTDGQAKPSAAPIRFSVMFLLGQSEERDREKGKGIPPSNQALIEVCLRLPVLRLVMLFFLGCLNFLHGTFFWVHTAVSSCFLRGFPVCFCCSQIAHHHQHFCVICRSSSSLNYYHFRVSRVV